MPAPAKDAVPTKDVAPAKTWRLRRPRKARLTRRRRGPAGAGYYLRVVAFKDRGQAEGLATRLSGKGYSAYVGAGASNLYSVRVGKYKTRKEADAIRRRLEKEEQLKPLISH